MLQKAGIRCPAAGRPRPVAPPHRARLAGARAGLMDAAKTITTAGQISELKEGIATFYNESSGLWEEVWGEHMHHGYYPRGGAPKSNQQAQVDMIDESLRWAGVASVSKMADVGCGIGGSSRHIARRFGAQADGITLSSVQAARANELSQQQGLGSQCRFQVADAQQQPFADGQFDLVWSMESGEHMPDKRQFVSELVRVCAPGGTVLVVTWCCRQGRLAQDEQALLDRICEAYYLPAWVSAADYQRLFEQQGLEGVRTADWSDEVAPFWGAVIRSAFTARGLLGLLQAGWTTIKGALVMPLMAQGYRRGVIKFNLIVGKKPPQC